MFGWQSKNITHKERLKLTELLHSSMPSIYTQHVQYTCNIDTTCMYPIPTSIVLPFMAVMTSPGLMAEPDGMFSHRGMRPTTLQGR